MLCVFKRESDFERLDPIGFQKLFHLASCFEILKSNSRDWVLCIKIARRWITEVEELDKNDLAHFGHTIELKDDVLAQNRQEILIIRASEHNMEYGFSFLGLGNKRVVSWVSWLEQVRDELLVRVTILGKIFDFEHDLRDEDLLFGVFIDYLLFDLLQAKENK